jgi:hypothetical protein
LAQLAFEPLLRRLFKGSERKAIRALNGQKIRLFERRPEFLDSHVCDLCFGIKIRASMSNEFDGLDATEKAGIGATLNRCRALAAKIANALRNKRPEQFADKLSLADIHTSLERAADVLSTVKGSQARGRQNRR